MKKIILALIMSAFFMSMVSCHTYIRDENGKSVDAAFGEYDDFWGYSVIVVNESDVDVRVYTYQDKESCLSYTCYAGGTRRVHHTNTKVIIGEHGCEILSNELNTHCDNVITISPSGNVFLDYYSNYLNEYYDGE